MNLSIAYPWTKPPVKRPPWWQMPFRLFWYVKDEQYIVFSAWRRCGHWHMPFNEERVDPESGIVFLRIAENAWSITSVDPPGSITIGGE